MTTKRSLNDWFNLSFTLKVKIQLQLFLSWLGAILFSLLICQICEVGSFGDPGGMGLGWPKDPVSSSVSVFIQKKLNIIHPMQRWSLKINFVVKKLNVSLLT